MAYIDDPDHEIAQRIASRANEIYGESYRVDWAYIDSRRNYIYNGSDYVASIHNGQVKFDRGRNRYDWVMVDLSEFLGGRGQ